MILQFVTIFISYNISEAILNRIKERKEEKLKLPKEKSTGNGKLFLLILIGIAIYYSFSVYKTRNEVNTEFESIEESSSKTPAEAEPVSDVYSNSPNYYSNDYSNQDVDSTELVTSIDYGIQSKNQTYEDTYSEDDDNYTTENEVETSGKYYHSRSYNIDEGDLEVQKINDSKFSFHLRVKNQNNVGEVKGVATFISSGIAQYTDRNCGILSFEFIKHDAVKITESDCDGYHGKGINFNSVFKR